MPVSPPETQFDGKPQGPGFRGGEVDLPDPLGVQPHVAPAGERASARSGKNFVKARDLRRHMWNILSQVPTTSWSEMKSSKF